MSQLGSIKIVENFKIIGKDRVIIQAFTGSGLVASIVAHHMIEKLNLTEKGYITSDLIPSVGIVRNGVIQRPVRIFENEEYLLVISEVGIPQENLNEFVESLFDWYASIDPASIVIVGALPTGRPNDADDLKYNVVASDSLTQSFIKKKGVWTMPRGAVYGSVALSLMEANRCGLSSFAILSHCIATIPDYLAAKKVVEIFKILLEDSIPVDPLSKNAVDLKEHLIRKAKNKKRSNVDDEDDEDDYEEFGIFSDYSEDEDEDDDDLQEFV